MCDQLRTPLTYECGHLTGEIQPYKKDCRMKCCVLSDNHAYAINDPRKCAHGRAKCRTTWKEDLETTPTVDGKPGNCPECKEKLMIDVMETFYINITNLAAPSAPTRAS